MRITNNTMFLNLQRQLNLSNQSTLRAQEQVSTEKRINRVSDAPVDAGRVLDLKSLLAQTDQYNNNIDRVSAMTTVQDETLGQVNDLLKQAKTLLLAENNEASSTAQTRESARIQYAMLTSQLVQIGNTQYDGQYLFSGYQTDTPAFLDAQVGATAGGANTGAAAVTGTAVTEATKLTYDNYQIQFTAPGQFNVLNTTSGQTVLSNQTYTSGQAIQFDGVAVTLSDSPGGPATGDTFNVALTPPGTYQGDGQVQQVAVQNGQTVPLNIPGNRLFQGNGVSGGVDMFDLFNQIGDALKSNDQTAMGNLLGQLDTAQTQVSNERSAVGARTNLLDQVKSRNDDISLQLDSLRSNLEDIDLTEATTNLTKTQTAYTATLYSASKIMQNSLLDFLH